MTRSPFRHILLAGTVCLTLMIAACQPAPDVNQLGTQIAAHIYATLTASIPSPTLPPPATPTPRVTLTPTRFLTPTPQPQARVHSNGLNLRQGPGRDQPTIETLVRNDILLVVGKRQDCEWLKVFSPSGSKGWVSGDPIYVVLDAPCSQIPSGSYRPLNGELLVDDPGVNGLGELTISNAGEQDMVVAVTNYAGGLLYALFIRSHESAGIAAIPDGSYTLTMLEGKEWVGDLGIFVYPTRATSLQDPYVFRTTTLANTAVSLVLGASPETVPMNPIPLEDFPLSQGDE
ncbi:MAG: SH3 domain-containing protein [Anaerolineae bacterium]|nr:SH3 domain-containing protein [Anaerolineae bacterium]